MPTPDTVALAKRLFEIYEADWRRAHTVGNYIPDTWEELSPALQSNWLAVAREAQRASDLAQEILIPVRYDEGSGSYLAKFAGQYGQGPTAHEARRSCLSAIDLWIKTVKEHGL